MIRRALGLTVVGGGLFLVAACSTEDAATAKYPDADSFCAAKAKAECDVVAAACVVGADQCKTARTNACTTQAGTYTGQGRTYRSANAEACITKTTAVYADRVIDPVKEAAYEDACNRVFTGNVQKNQACANIYDCADTLACDLDKKVCAVKSEKKLTDPCNNPGDICGTGLYCQLSGGTLKVCTAKNKLGESCDATNAPCTDDLRCNGAQCVALEAAAQPCDKNDDCSTHFCNADKKCQAKQYASETGSCKDFGGS